MAVVNLTETERALLWDAVRRRLAELGERTERAGDADDVDAVINCAQVCAQLLRGLEKGTLNLGVPGLLTVLEDHRTGVLEGLKVDRQGLAKGRAGEYDYADSLLDELTACDALLGRARAA